MIINNFGKENFSNDLQQKMNQQSFDYDLLDVITSRFPEEEKKRKWLSELEYNQKKIDLRKQEKRKRHQTYILLDYALSCFTYFDFLSYDCFQLVTHSKYLAQIGNQSQVTSEYLLLPYFFEDSKIRRILYKFDFQEHLVWINIKKKEIQRAKQEGKKPKKLNPFSIFVKDFMKKNIFDYPKREQFLEDLKETFPFLNKYNTLFWEELEYSKEMCQIFEKAAENALIRFKTPIISSEILLLTAMEEKDSEIGDILKLSLRSDHHWHLMRYELIKQLYFQASSIRGEIDNSQYFFAHLLKTEMLEDEYQDIMGKKTFSDAVFGFRNCLISSVLQLNLSGLMNREIENSIKLTSIRRYSN